MSMLFVEDLPPYTPSRPPSYLEVEPERCPISPGLPRMQQYAPGFHPRPSYPFSANPSNYASVNRPCNHRSGNLRQFGHLAQSRLSANHSCDSLQTSSPAHIHTPIQQDSIQFLTCSPTPQFIFSSLGRFEESASTPSGPIVIQDSPLEDPELVGPVAAERNRQARLYREMIHQDSTTALDAESRSWDFMLAQSHDWQGRERSWQAFRKSREPQRPMISLGRSALLLSLK